jgi:bifunctional non-homologous end joining protein LigD
MRNVIVPMMARLADIPSNDSQFAFELKWDGIRAIIFLEKGRVRIQSRNLLDLTRQYPELSDAPKELRKKSIVLDGEIVALNKQGVPSFEQLQQRMHLTASKASLIARDVPAIYMVFDLLYLGNESLMALPYTERRAKLEKFFVPRKSWQLSTYHVGDGKELLSLSKARGFEGLIGKRLDSIYEPGRRSGAWIKIKNSLRQEAVIGGWLPGEGSRGGRIGALLVGYYDYLPNEARRRGEKQKLIFAGKVGTGFTDKMLVEIAAVLMPLRRIDNPFDVDKPKYRAAIYVEPRLVGEIQFTEWTAGHMMRHPSFKGLREDKNAEEVVREVKS